MKFLDPWASFQYLGGMIPIHISMSIYCAFVSHQKEKELGFMSDCESIDHCSTVQYIDLKVMLFAHIFCLFTIVQKFIFTNLNF